MGRRPAIAIVAFAALLAITTRIAAPARAANGPSWAERIAAAKKAEPDGIVISLPALAPQSAPSAPTTAGDGLEPCVRVERDAQIAVFLDHCGAASPRDVLLGPGAAPEAGRLVLLHSHDVLLSVSITEHGFRVPVGDSNALAFTSLALLRWTKDRLTDPDRRVMPPRTAADLAPRIATFEKAVASQGAEKPKIGELVKNGNFEEKVTNALSPIGWDRVDGVTTFWIVDSVDPKGHGHVLAMDTDVYESEWKRRQDEMAKDPDSAPWPKTPVPMSDQYATVGGNHGVSFYCDAMPVEPGRPYRLTLAFRTDLPSGTAKAWVRGFGTMETKRGPESRRLYDGLVTLRMGSPGWKTHSMVFHPTKATPSVTTMRVMLYGYWPRGGYAFDDVSVKPISDEEYEKAKETERSDVK
jgi:hypothetical protein